MLRAAAPEVDSTSIEQHLKVIRTALARIRTMKTKLTELGSCTHAINERLITSRARSKKRFLPSRTHCVLVRQKDPPAST